MALGIDSACSWAGVLTLGVDAGLVLRAVKAEKTLRLAANERVSLVVSDTLADSLPTLLSALGICATWAGVARVLRSGRLRDDWLLGAPRKWISNSAWWTAAYGVVILNLTNRKYPTGSWTRINALLCYASKSSRAVSVSQAFSFAPLV